MYISETTLRSMVGFNRNSLTGSYTTKAKLSIALPCYVILSVMLFGCMSMSKRVARCRADTRMSKKRMKIQKREKIQPTCISILNKMLVLRNKPICYVLKRSMLFLILDYQMRQICYEDNLLTGQKTLNYLVLKALKQN